MQSARRRLGLALALVGVLVAFLVTAPAAFAVKACESANATPASVSKRTIVRATLCTINSQRWDAGLRPLKLNRKLSKAARRHARDMDRHNYFSHDSLGGGNFLDRIRSTGYLNGAGSWTVGENLGWGTHGASAPRTITRMWMNSAGHRANILSPSFREIGIGVAYGAPVAGAGRPAATYATDFGRRN